MFNFNQKGVSSWAIIIVLAFMVAAMIVALWPQDESLQENISPATLWQNIKKTTSSVSEKARIEKWIVDNKLNQYGDSADTLYAGGTPLFNEAIGERIDRYEYIKQNHPSQPWNK